MKIQLRIIHQNHINITISKLSNYNHNQTTSEIEEEKKLNHSFNKNHGRKILT